MYWLRRLLVIGSALALVVAVGSLLTRGSDGSGGDGSAVQVSADRSSDSSPATTDKPKKSKPKKKKDKPTKAPLAQPSGPCAPSDIVVLPVVKDAVAGSPVTLRLRLSTRFSPACTWTVSADTLALKVTSGRDAIWSSQQCPRAVPTKEVVLRTAKPAWVSVSWSARRSTDECGGGLWALQGWYHLTAAPLAGEPQDVQFKLSTPQAPVITQSPSPSATKGKGTKGEGKKGGKKSGSGGESSPTDQPTGSPSGAVEPNG